MISHYLMTFEKGVQQVRMQPANSENPRRGREDFIDNQPVPLASLRGKCLETSSVFMMIPSIAPLTL